MNLGEKLRDVLPDDGQAVYGFADLKGLLNDRFKGYNYGIVIGKKLDDRIIDSILAGPNEPYYRLYRETNEILSGLVHRVAEVLESGGISCIPIEPTVTEKQLDQRTLIAEFSHKMAATRAGIGWIGKTALLVSRRFGPRLRLATVLTGHPPESCGPPVDESRCGSCTLCVEWCPARAANGLLWNIRMSREEFFDPFRCRETCLELSRKNIKKDVSICGICVSICPIGRK